MFLAKLIMLCFIQLVFYLVAAFVTFDFSWPQYLDDIESDGRAMLLIVWGLATLPLSLGVILVDENEGVADADRS